jgi:hypothetical protein
MVLPCFFVLHSWFGEAGQNVCFFQFNLEVIKKILQRKKQLWPITKLFFTLQNCPSLSQFVP